MSKDELQPCEEATRLHLGWKVCLLLSLLLSLTAIWASFQSARALFSRLPLRELRGRDDVLIAQSYSVDGRSAHASRGTFQMEGDSVRLDARGECGYIDIRVPDDAPPWCRIKANGAHKDGAMLEVKSSSPDDISVSVIDSRGTRRLVLGLSPSGDPYFRTCSHDGSVAWSIPTTVSESQPGSGGSTLGSTCGSESTEISTGARRQ